MKTFQKVSEKYMDKLRRYENFTIDKTCQDIKTYFKSNYSQMYSHYTLIGVCTDLNSVIELEKFLNNQFKSLPGFVKSKTETDCLPEQETYSVFVAYNRKFKKNDVLS